MALLVVTIVALLCVLYVESGACLQKSSLAGKADHSSSESVANNPAASAGSITATGQMSTARAGHTATLLPNGKVLITGGFSGDNERYPFATAELYDPTATFTPTGSMTTGRQSHTATLLPNGKVLIIGGYDNGETLGTAEVYDPATEAFSVASKLNTARWGHKATLLANGKVLITGGHTGSTLLTSAELYDPLTNRFTFTGNMLSPRAAYTATLLQNGKVLIAGGSHGRYPSHTILRSAELYDPAIGAFTPTGDLNTARHKHAATLLPDGKVLIAGGSDARDWRGRYASAELYDPMKNTFTATGSMNTPRFKHEAAIVLLRNGRVLLAGGDARAEVYDYRAGTFTPAAGSMGAGRFFSTATLLPSGKVLITGGYGNDAVSTAATAWLYQP